MFEDGVADLKDDALAHVGGEVEAQKVDTALQQREQEQSARRPDNALCLPIQDQLIYCPSQDQGRRQFRRRGQQRSEDHSCQQRGVGAHVLEQPSQNRADGALGAGLAAFAGLSWCALTG